MRDKGIDHEYVLIEGEGHGFATPASRHQVFGSMERFLAKHLAGRSQD